MVYESYQNDGYYSENNAYFDDYADVVDGRSCRLLGPTALIVQALIGLLIILSLVYKRYLESPKRPWRIWLFDVSKQVVGQMFVHGVNVLVSDQLSHHTSSNACVSYFLNILIDTTLGVAFLYFTLHFISDILTTHFKLKGFQSGVYGSPPSMTFWARQATIYVIALTTMKLLVLALLSIFPGIFSVGAWLLSWTWTKEGDWLQVILVMGVFPILMNVLQFWLIDSIVKASTVQPEAPTDVESADHPDRAPLFSASSDDEDEDPLPRTTIPEPRRPSPPSSRSSSPDKETSVTRVGSVENKSMSSTPVTHDVTEHSYPPSLSSSLATASTSRTLSTVPRRRSSSASIPEESTASSSKFHETTDEWTESWDDNDDWEHSHDAETRVGGDHECVDSEDKVWAQAAPIPSKDTVPALGHDRLPQTDDPAVDIH